MAQHMAVWAAEEGHRVLLVDLDFQSHATKRLGVTMEPDAPSIGDVLVAQKQRGVKGVILELNDTLHLAPGVMKMVRLERQIFTDARRLQYLGNALQPVADNYELCIIDTHPDLGAFTETAMHLAEVTIAPIPYEAGGLDGYSDLEEAWQDVKGGSDAQLWAVMNKLDKRNTVTTRAIDDTVSSMEVPRLKAIVPKVEAINQAQLVNETIFDRLPNSEAAACMASVFTELLKKLGGL